MTTDLSDPKHRFSNRVKDYVRFRPSYPPALLTLLRDEARIGPEVTVADMGSGTGILTDMLLQTGCRVLGVEPNRLMREAAEDHLESHPRFQSVAGSAEASGLSDASVDLVTAAQAFHWFRVDESGREFRRILRPEGTVVLLWDSRRVEGTPFLKGYEHILRQWGTDYTMVRRSYDVDKSLARLFGNAEIKHRTFTNNQFLTYEVLEGRLLSSSYVPTRADSSCRPLLTALTNLFQEHAVDNTVKMLYDTQVYYGKLDRV